VLPWNAVFTRLDRYLRISYIAATIAGLAIAAEITVVAIPGSPEQRRHRIASATEAVFHHHLSALLVVLAILIALCLAYMVGVTGRTLTLTVVNTLITAVILGWKFTFETWWQGTRDYSTLGTEEEKWERRPVPQRLRFWWLTRVRHKEPYEWQIEHRRLLAVVGGSLAQQLLAPLFPPVIQLSHVWTWFEFAYGADTVNRALARHPITARVEAIARLPQSRRERAFKDGESAVGLTLPYCELWLRRFAPESAVVQSQTRVTVLATAAVPALLLPATLLAVGSDLDQVVALITPLWLLIALGALVFVVGTWRERSSYPLAIFRRFVDVQMTDIARPGDGFAANAGANGGAAADVKPPTPDSDPPPEPASESD
jgi:hypothetical protein